MRLSVCLALVCTHQEVIVKDVLRTLLFSIFSFFKAKVRVSFNQEPSCCEVTVLTTAAPLKHWPECQTAEAFSPGLYKIDSQCRHHSVYDFSLRMDRLIRPYFKRTCYNLWFQQCASTLTL